jgi:hypothetical protein
MNTVQKQTSTMAIISFIGGVLGWTFLPFLGSLAAIVCGHMARSEIKKNPETQTGDGFAIAGLILGWGMVLITILSIIAIILIFGGIAAFLAVVGLSSGGGSGI